VDDLAGIDQSSHYLASNAEAEVALHAGADNAGELLIRSLARSGIGNPNQRRCRARVGIRLSASSKQANSGGKNSGGSGERRYGHLDSSCSADGKPH
jgi:hypothetical protein